MNMKDNLRSILCLGLSLSVSMAFLVSTAATAHAQKGTRERKLRAANASRPQGRCDPLKQEQTDLSGTYTGKLTQPDGTVIHDATLTITGNDFTFTAASDVHSGRITAVTTCGYTAVTLMAGDLTPPPPGPNPPVAQLAISLRAKKLGNHLTLTSVAGEKQTVSFQCDCSKCTNACDCCA